jgi:hypothetical protein
MATDPFVGGDSMLPISRATVFSMGNIRSHESTTRMGSPLDPMALSGAAMARATFCA